MKRKPIITVEKWDQINPVNKKLFKDYIFNCKADDKSKETIESYTLSIKLFLIWVFDNKENVDVFTLTKRDYQEYSIYIRDRGVSSATHNSYISPVKNMMEFAEDSDEKEYSSYVKNTCNKVKGLKIQRVMKKTYLTDEQVTKLYNLLLERKQYKMALYLALSYDSTARVSEILSIEKYCFLEDDRNNTNPVHKKGYAEKFPIIYFNRTKEAIKLYLNWRGEDNIDTLWLGLRKNACTINAAEHWCKVMSKILSEIEGQIIRFSPHDLRRSSIENYHNGTHYMCEIKIERIPVPIQDIQLLANHKTSEMTNYYLKNNKQQNLENAFGIKIVN